MRSHHRSLAALVVTSASLVALPPALADDEVKAAEEFDLGLARKEAGDLDGACAAFLRSEILVPAIGTKFNLGECALRRGALLEAARLYAAARDAAVAAGDLARAERAGAELAAVQLVTPAIRFDAPPGARAFIDGRAVAIGGETRLDPGRHQVELIVAGAPPVRRTIVLERGRVETVRAEPVRTEPVRTEPVRTEPVRPPEPGPPGEPPIAATVPASPDAPTATRPSRWPAIGAGAGAVVLAGVATYFTLSARDDDAAADALCPMPGACPGTAAAASELNHSAYVDSRIGLGLYVGAGALAGVAAYLGWRAMRTPSLEVRPTAGGVAVTFGGGF